MIHSPEVDAFVRWIVMNPHKLVPCLQDPDGFLAAANVGPDASAFIKGLGREGLVALVKTTGEAIMADPNADGTVQRDRNVSGFGARPSSAPKVVTPPPWAVPPPAPATPESSA